MATPELVPELVAEVYLRVAKVNPEVVVGKAFDIACQRVADYLMECSVDGKLAFMQGHDAVEQSIAALVDFNLWTELT